METFLFAAAHSSAWLASGSRVRVLLLLLFSALSVMDDEAMLREEEAEERLKLGREGYVEKVENCTQVGPYN